MKKALITGITGQDGSYLAEFLLNKGYKVYGLVRRSSNDPFVRLSDAVKRQVKIVYGNLRDTSALERAIQECMPHEVYNLAAQSDVGISFKNPEETTEVDYYGVGRLVNAIQKIKPDTRVYQASTSEMFGKTNPTQNEDSPFQPVSPYGEAKLKAHEDFVEGYREKHGLFICSGFLFNHESPRRGEHFVTRKITISLAKIKLGLQKSFELGNLDAKRDWGFAGDYVEAMWLMLQQDTPQDFVIATGVAHTVREFVVASAETLGMKITFSGKGNEEVGKDEKGKVILRVNPKFYRPKEVGALCGDASKAKRLLGWKPKTSFEELAALMARADYEKFSNAAPLR
ncbi:GDP-mannose 4,6-dehydratase [Candidatus Kaiserbacteria bacterium RIFCSPHIGHO2_02_FULL_54_11b]|uniref:GDP-mannose 4,6-dehydratase n=2 Tax=Candidatus Kaiseribacteriota TaxID=1752734 RepID=A0A1F6CRE2_9BACT|nr:MAG: GDP-mannose 4,6-dehydratase [Candidatus Kaiserbacteria bacterium RIFCSPHIGHO2_01_FULL_54_36b]OGG64651.1 MAG: GDP-mannose 4,6-dehydratase [Candidatus Kaiserbacteria bacterium RIFCSPHIGHO2_02_FULL_54_11b]